MGDGDGDPRLIDVFAAGGGLRRGKGALHRLDKTARCPHGPESVHTSTDLVTAAVANEADDREGHHLCPYCEWPEGAEEVLEGVYEDDG